MEFRIGSIVYHQEFGIGKITGYGDWYLYVDFLNYETKKMIDTHIQPLTIDIIIQYFPKLKDLIQSNSYTNPSEIKKIFDLYYPQYITSNLISKYYIVQIARKHNIEKFVRNSKIKRVIHFTNIDNVISILENGILSRKDLDIKSIQYHSNDQLRLDKHPDAISCSISLPNPFMAYKYQTYENKVVLAYIEIKPNILWEKNCLFSKDNAAKSYISDMHNDICDLKKMFEDYDDNHKREMVIDFFKKEGLQTPYSAIPTNPQAEVLVLENIDISYIQRIDINIEKSKFKEQYNDDLLCKLNQLEIEYRFKTMDNTEFSKRGIFEYDFWKNNNAEDNIIDNFDNLYF